VALRQRAIKRGLTLSEYALLRLEDNVIVASETEEAIYNALELDYIPPELRENCGELEAAAAHTLPQLITREDIRGDLHMHTFETDGTCSIREMAEAALLRGHRYIAITDHSKHLSMTNGMNDERALAHAARVRAVNQEMGGRIHIFTGIECDILPDGSMDLADETLAQLDIVVASVHGKFDLSQAEQTTRILRALDNPYVRILGHPTGRKLLGRDPIALDLEAVFTRAAANGVAVEHNAAPARTDLSDANMRLAKSLGCKIIIDTDAHATGELDYMADGIIQLRRAWLTPNDVLNTASTPEAFLAQLRSRP
jgi:DNA polymerase (family 10)